MSGGRRVQWRAEPGEAARLRNMTFAIGCLFMLLVALHMVVLDLPLRASGSEWAPALLALLVFGGMVAVRDDPASHIGVAAAGAGLMISFNVLGAALGLLVLRWGTPQADALLLAADSRLGADMPALIEALSHWPMAMSVLQKVFGMSLPVLLLAVMSAGLLGHQARMWRACAMFGGCLLTVCLLSGLVPAKGVFLTLDAASIERLPAHAGTFAFATFDHFRSGAAEGISLSTLNGAACFPSFHTAAALILCQCAWPARRLRVPVTLWSGLVIASTVPIGGHYLVDVAAGALIFLAWSMITRPGRQAEARQDLRARHLVSA